MMPHSVADEAYMLFAHRWTDSMASEGQEVHAAPGQQDGLDPIRVGHPARDAAVVIQRFNPALGAWRYHWPAKSSAGGLCRRPGYSRDWPV